MKKLSMKTLITTILCLGLFGIVRADETTTTGVSVSGEFSTDITFGDATTFVSPYQGLTFSGDGWGSHRPSNNWFVSSPRDHSISNGVGVEVDKWGFGTSLFYGGGEEDNWGARFSYGLSLFGIDSKLGLSLNSNEAQLLDVSTSSGMFETSFEYDLSEEADGAYWLRGVVTPLFGQGAYLLVGYNSDEEVLYGVGYKCSDKMKIVTEFSSEDEDGKDISIRASYSF